MSDIAEKVRTLMSEHEEDFVNMFKHLHRHPELSFQEFETTSLLKDYLKSLDIEILDYGLETGVIGLLRGAEDGPCIGLRADIDALPLLEESGCDYASVVPGRMHACGHDVHTSALMGAAYILSQLRSEIKGSVKFIFQPAEEINLGAKKLMEHEVMFRPKVDALFGIHNSTEVNAGEVAVKRGPLMAAVDRIEFTIKGKGGHGGIPQNSIDPVVAAASVIMSAQTIVSRNTGPLDSAVVSMCNIRAGEGTTNNVIPDSVTVLGTVRTYRREVQDMVERRLGEIINNVSQAYGCSSVFRYLRELPVTENGPELYDAAYRAVSAVAKPMDPQPSGGGEDFSIYYAAGAPCFFYWVGARNEETGCIWPWHSPRFKADLRAVTIGAGTYAMSVFTAIEELRK
ncbi:MAG: amidohydrolase [Lachnospiraceae bacterium]|nr:amidohydrolase [Lachnospiraceae bacterium]